MTQDLLIPTDKGLYCPLGDFYVDPWRPVERAVVTHAHSDHARAGCGSYLCARSCEPLLRLRVHPGASIESVEFGVTTDVGGVRVSLHPAGHILGSAQVRLEHHGRVTVFTGDFKRETDPAAEQFELVRCDHFITESTFALPIYRWKARAEIADEINGWWRESREQGRASIVYAYALGKAQRVLSMVDASIGPILVHGAVDRFLDSYREAGIALPKTRYADAQSVKETRGTAIIIAPPSAAGSVWARKFGPASTAFASGWMQVRGPRRRRNVDRGFVLSDHADWPGLLDVIGQTGASRIDATHGYTQPLTRYLRERGYDARAIPTRYEGETDAEGGGEGDRLDTPEAGGAGGAGGAES